MPSYYLNQCWLIVKWTIRNKHHWNLNGNVKVFFEEKGLELVVCKMVAILFRPHHVNVNITQFWTLTIEMDVFNLKLMLIVEWLHLYSDTFPANSITGHFSDPGKNYQGNWKHVRSMFCSNYVAYPMISCSHWLSCTWFLQLQDINDVKLYHLMLKIICFLTHCGRVVHICISKLSIIGSDNGFVPFSHYLDQCGNIVN